MYNFWTAAMFPLLFNCPQIPEGTISVPELVKSGAKHLDSRPRAQRPVSANGHGDCRLGTRNDPPTAFTQHSPASRALQGERCFRFSLHASSPAQRGRAPSLTPSPTLGKTHPGPSLLQALVPECAVPGAESCLQGGPMCPGPQPQG